ncbi:MAG: LytTR family DNA-binding domain-containing protein [Lachnospiraceae bacterium]
MKIAIVEDQLYWQEEIKKILNQRYGSEVEVQCFGTSAQFLSELEYYDIIFMDIELESGKEDGFSIAHKYKFYYRDTILIILTSHTELYSKGYQVEAFRYIDKAKLKEIEEALESAELKLVQQKKVKINIVSTGQIEVKIRDMLYFETYGRNLNLHTEKGVYECVGNISALADNLKEYGLFLIHRSYLVNLDAIISLERKTVILKNGEKLELSVHRYKEFKHCFFEWKFQNGNG